MFGILTWPGRERRGWDCDSFFATGRADLETLWAQVDSAGVTVPRGGHVLDFGCGIGRLTRGLSERFDQVDGVDASRTMISRARELHRGQGLLRFHVNDSDDLRLFESDRFDAVVSLITLQHIPPPATRRYLAEFVRVIRPGGLIAVQLPAARLASPPAIIQWTLDRAREVVRRLPHPYEMHIYPEAEVRGVFEDAGAQTLAVVDDRRVGDWGRSLLYLASRG